MARRRTLPEQRFRAYMLELTATGCWIWARTEVNKQYFWTGEKSLNVRRYAYMAHFDTLPSRGQYLKPGCDHPGCIRPEHQKIVSKRELAATRLSNDQIEKILHEINKRTSYRELAHEFGVSHQTIANVVHGKLKVTG